MVQDKRNYATTRKHPANDDWNMLLKMGAIALSPLAVASFVLSFSPVDFDLGPHQEEETTHRLNSKETVYLEQIKGDDGAIKIRRDACEQSLENIEFPDSQINGLCVTDHNGFVIGKDIRLEALGIVVADDFARQARSDHPCSPNDGTNEISVIRAMQNMRNYRPYDQGTGVFCTSNPTAWHVFLDPAEVKEWPALQL